jgi:hypothetical protein
MTLKELIYTLKQKMEKYMSHKISDLRLYTLFFCLTASLMRQVVKIYLSAAEIIPKEPIPSKGVNLSSCL